MFWNMFFPFPWQMGRFLRFLEYESAANPHGYWGDPRPVTSGVADSCPVRSASTINPCKSMTYKGLFFSATHFMRLQSFTSPPSCIQGIQLIPWNVSCRYRFVTLIAANSLFELA